MRTLGRLLAGGALAAAILVVAPTAASGCTLALATLTVSPMVVDPGQAVEVVGQSFYVLDPNPPTTTTTIGTGTTLAECAAVLPSGPVELRFVQAGRSTSLATATPRPDSNPNRPSGFVVSFVIPATATPGPATIVAVGNYLNSGHLQVAELTVRGAPPVVMTPRYTG